MENLEQIKALADQVAREIRYEYIQFYTKVSEDEKELVYKLLENELTIKEMINTKYIAYGSVLNFFKKQNKIKTNHPEPTINFHKEIQYEGILREILAGSIFEPLNTVIKNIKEKYKLRFKDDK